MHFLAGVDPISIFLLYVLGPALLIAIAGSVIGGLLAAEVLRGLSEKPPNNAERIIGCVIVVVIGGIFGIACLLSAVYVISQL